MPEVFDSFRSISRTPSNAPRPFVEDVQLTGSSDKKNVVISKSDKEGAKPFGTWLKEIPEIRIIKDGFGEPFLIPPTMVSRFRISESIQRIAIFAELILSDKLDFTNKFPLDGNEIIEAKVRSMADVQAKVLKFEILHIETDSISGPDGKRTQVFISLAQYPVWRNVIGKKISRGYANQTVSSIVKDLNLNFLKTEKIDINPTQGKIESFCVPYWDLLTTFDFLEEIALNSDNRGNFFTWHNTFNILNFKSLADLYNQSPKLKFFVRDSDTKREEQVIIDYHSDNIRKEYFRAGLGGTTAAGYNWVKGKYVSEGQTFSEASRDIKGSHKLYGDSIDDRFGEFIYKGWGDPLFLKAVQDTKVSSAINSQLHMEVDVNGVLQITAGNVIEIQRSRKFGRKDELERTREMDGVWVVQDITHLWSSDIPYRQRYRLIRDSYFNKPNPELKA